MFRKGLLREPKFLHRFSPKLLAYDYHVIPARNKRDKGQTTPGQRCNQMHFKMIYRGKVTWPVLSDNRISSFFSDF